MDPSRRLPRRVPDHATIGKIGADSRKHRGRSLLPAERYACRDNCGLLCLVPGKLDSSPSVDPSSGRRVGSSREGKERNEEEGRRVGDAVGSSR